VGWTTTAIACVVSLLIVAGCGGETTAAPQARDAPFDAPSAPRGGDASESGIDTDRDGAADSAAEAAPLACTSPRTCPADLALQPGLDRPVTTARCCIDDLCSNTPPASCADVKDLAIRVSSYDQSCSVDSDCTTAVDVSACYGPIGCDGAPIAKTALSQYQSDVAMLPTSPCWFPEVGCTPPPLVGMPCGLCCRSGACQVGDACCGDAY
jgi:hypothetical protein